MPVTKPTDCEMHFATLLLNGREKKKHFTKHKMNCASGVICLMKEE
jgi:hypothetical protein